MEFEGTEKPFTTVESPSLLITEGPAQLETPAELNGAAIIKKTIDTASLVRLLGMVQQAINSVMNQSAIISYSHFGATGGN